MGAECKVIAPSLVPRRPGDKIKTDRRDALKLLEYLENGQLVEVLPPSEEQEAVRDLCRRVAAVNLLTDGDFTYKSLAFMP